MSAVRPRTWRYRWWLAAALGPLGCVAALHAQAPASATLVPEQSPPVLPWVELEYTTRKLFLLATTTASLSLATPASVASQLRVPPSGSPLPLPGTDVADLTVSSTLPFGRREVMRLLFDPRTGTAFGSDKLTTGRRSRRSVARYLREGIYTWSWAPADGREERLDPAQWTDRRERFVPYPAELPPDCVVTDAYALLVLTSSMRPDAAARVRPLLVLSYHGFMALDFAAGGSEGRRVNVEEQEPSGSRRRSGREQLGVWRVSARAVPPNPAATPHDLGVVGFQGGVTLLVDPQTGVTLSLRGKADYVGTVTTDLVRIRLATDPPGPRDPAR
jgi:hypothetical protein